MSFFNEQIPCQSAKDTYKERNLGVVPDVLTKQGCNRLMEEVRRLQNSGLFEQNRNLTQVNSGKLLKSSPLFQQFAESKELNDTVNRVVSKPYRVAVCPGDPSTEYSLMKSDFGFKVNYYDGDKDSGIGWHYDKNHSWKEDTIVVIYNILYREKTELNLEVISKPPPCYEIIENGRKISFSIPENSLHIHNTNRVYHRAITPRGYARAIFILHFTKAPCLPSSNRNGFSLDLIARNVLMRAYVETFVEIRGQILLAVALIFYLFYVSRRR